MAVLDELVKWSKSRPLWQRDALRRLAETGELSAGDIRELADICKTAYGLSELRSARPIESSDVTVSGTGVKAVRVQSIFHHRGVNALAAEQCLTIGPNLTIVYGDNGAGKTGYIRILKSACRARGRESILGNVLSASAPPAPLVSIKYQLAGEQEPREWAGADKDDNIARISVFDTQAGAVHLNEKTDVAFRPFGLDLFDKLVQACRAVKNLLDEDRRSLATTVLGAWISQIPVATAVAKLIAELTSLTKPDTVRALAQLRDGERERLSLLENMLRDLQANDPAKLSAQLALRAARVRLLSRHLQRVEEGLSEAAFTKILATRGEGRQKRREAERLREATLSSDILPGTGTEPWTAMWESARHFSEHHAYQGVAFPNTAEGARCVLCQQPLQADGGNRFRRFEEFVATPTEKELRDIRERFAKLRKALTDIVIESDAIQELVRELKADNEEMAAQVETAVTIAAERKRALLSALTTDGDLDSACPSLGIVSVAVTGFAEQLETRAQTLQKQKDENAEKLLLAEAQELRARRILGEHLTNVLEEIERKQHLAAFELCSAETKTNAITQKSTALTRAVVTEKLQQSFQQELQRLAFRDVEVHLAESGGSEGILYHKLVFTRAPNVEVPKVASEGQQRCLSIAAFFAELSTADTSDGIVFDDPISSLDFRYRNAVAVRLVEEAQSRQVVVFTHDLLFFHELSDIAERLSIEQHHQHVRQLPTGAGVCIAQLPFWAMATKAKLGYLNAECQRLSALHRKGEHEIYERECKNLYFLLRETWERAVEEVLLGRVVERFRHSIETNRLAAISDISEADCLAVEAGMTNASKWCHDQAVAARTPLPGPAHLKKDIETLDQWIAVIHRRRKK